MDGYDEDERELHQVPEVSLFIRVLNGSCNHWLHFMEVSPDAFGWIVAIMTNMEGAVVVDGQKYGSYSPEVYHKWFQDQLTGIFNTNLELRAAVRW